MNLTLAISLDQATGQVDVSVSTQNPVLAYGLLKLGEIALQQHYAKPVVGKLIPVNGKLAEPKE